MQRYRADTKGFVTGFLNGEQVDFRPVEAGAVFTFEPLEGQQPGRWMIPVETPAGADGEAAEAPAPLTAPTLTQAQLRAANARHAAAEARKASALQKAAKDGDDTRVDAKTAEAVKVQKAAKAVQE